MAVVQAAIGTASSVLSYFGTERKKDSLREQRVIEKRRTRLEQEQRQRRERRLVGEQLAVGAAFGFEVGTGTSLNLLMEAESASRREARRIDYAGELALTNIDTAVDDLSNQQVFQIFNAATGTISQVGSAIAKDRTEAKSETQALIDKRADVASQGTSNISRGASVANSRVTNTRSASLSLLSSSGGK